MSEDSEPRQIVESSCVGDTLACTSGVPENCLIEQSKHFEDSRSSKSKRICLEPIRETEEQEEVQFMPLTKRSRKEESDVNCSVMYSRDNYIVNGSFLEALKFFEYQASKAILSDDDREEGVSDHNPLFGCDVVANGGANVVDPVQCVGESKRDFSSPLEGKQCKELEVEDFPVDVDEEVDEKDLLDNVEIETTLVQSEPAASLVPSDNEVGSENIVEDTEELLEKGSPIKQEVRRVEVFVTPPCEMPLPTAATTANQDSSFVQKNQDLCKVSENSNANSFSPVKKYTRKSKAIQKSKQKLNSVRPKEKKDQEKEDTFPDFDSYTIIEEEGSGGYGIVYKAKRKIDGKEFAIKCPHAGAQKQYVNNEIRMLERFGGRNFIIKYEGCLKHGDSDCIILEHLEHDRPDLLKREIDVYHLQLYGYCMFKALSSLHKQGIVHRDVKPGNFLFSRETDKGYLIDFNLAMDLHQKYRRADKSKAASDLPSTSKKHQTLVKALEVTNPVTNKSSQKAVAPSSLKKAAGKIRSRNDMSRWDRLNSQGAEGSGLTSAKDVTSTRNNPSGEKRREPLPCHGRKALLNFLQETMGGPTSNQEVSSKTPLSMRKRVAALPEKSEKELLYLTPMPLRSNGRPEALAGHGNQKKDGPCSGTKGFRAPEVCFRSLYQGSKIDVWSAGVTLVYLMMGKIPFTGDPEQNIKDIALLRGSEELWEVAKLHNRESSFPEELYDSRYLKGMDLRKWFHLNTKRRDFLDVIPRSLLDLVDKCLTVNPRLRISAEDALKHEFFSPIHETLRKQRLLKPQTQPHTSMVADTVGQTPNVQ